MTSVFITVDVECREERLSGRRLLPAAGYDLRVWGRFANQSRELGIDLIMGELEACGLRATFFVDPISSDSFGLEGLAGICQTLRARGHEVQLHTHPRQSRCFWFTRAEEPAPDAMAAYPLAQQTEILGRGVDLLLSCGVPRDELCAFRAGHYGANNDTWSAMREVGLSLGCSYNRSYLGKTCAIDWPRLETGLFHTGDGVWELPVTNLVEITGRLRHLQITAVSLAEMEQALLEANDLGMPEVVIVTHSFEFLHLDSVERRSGRLNQINFQRLRGLCRFLQRHRDRFQVETVGELARRLDGQPLRPPVLLRAKPTHQLRRLLEQAYKRIEARMPFALQVSNGGAC